MIKKDLNGYVSLSVEYQALPDEYLPFELEVERVYRAYRTCYSKEPWKDPKFTSAEQNELLCAYRKQLTDAWIDCSPIESEKSIEARVNNKIIGYLDKYGMDRLCMWIHRCQFITSHRNHLSPLEHASLTVTVDECSRVYTHQQVRHRLCSFSQASQRYINEEDPPLYIPASIEANPEALKIYSQYLNQLPNVIAGLKALGIPQEDIRYAYPNATKTRIVITANWREWIHILGERRCRRAQTEIRNNADAIYEYLITTVPFIFDDTSPKCHLIGKCPENKPCSRHPIQIKK